MHISCSFSYKCPNIYCWNRQELFQKSIKFSWNIIFKQHHNRKATTNINQHKMLLRIFFPKKLRDKLIPCVDKGGLSYIVEMMIIKISSGEKLKRKNELIINLRVTKSTQSEIRLDIKYAITNI